MAKPDRSDTEVGWVQTLADFPSRPVSTRRSGVLAVREHGRASAPTLVLLHGIGSGSASWAPQLQALGREFRLLAWDAPGYGDSDEPASVVPEAADWADALEDLLTTLGVTRAHLLGHSLGALVAAAFAARHPARVGRLMLASPAQGYQRLDAAERTKRMDARLSAFETLGPDAHADARAGRLLSHQTDPGRAEAGWVKAHALVRWNLARLRPAGYRAAVHLLAHGEILADVARLQMPVCVIAGGADTITPPAGCREVGESAPSGTSYHEIAQAGHACYIERPIEFNTVLRQCLGG